jgi:hypothetical protein
MMKEMRVSIASHFAEVLMMGSRADQQLGGWWNFHMA